MNKRTNRPVLLIADDDEDILEFLADDLGDDYDIWKCEDGEKVLSVIREEQIDLIISDIMMPHLDGYELCRVLKSNIEFSHIPVILLTAKNTIQSKIKGLEEGADAYIEKPFSPAHLKAQVESLLLNRKKIRQYFMHIPLVKITSIANSKADEIFLNEISELIIDNLTNEQLGVEFLAEKMNMSRPTLYRKIKSVSDLSPHDLITLTKLKKAATLLKTQQYRIFEVAYLAGFSSQTHLNRNFQKQFGMTPSEYVENHRKN